MRACSMVGAVASFATTLVIIFSITEYAGRAWGGEALSPAAELHGQLRQHPFVSEASGAFSRTVFETQDDPDFNITIRDLSFPPDGQPHVVTLPSSAVLSLISGYGDIRVDDKTQSFADDSRATVPANATINVLDTSGQPVVLRAVIVEAK